MTLDCRLPPASSLPPTQTSGAQPLENTSIIVSKAVALLVVLAVISRPVPATVNHTLLEGE